MTEANEANNAVENKTYKVVARIDTLAKLKNQSTEEYLNTRPDVVDYIGHRAGLIGVGGLEFRNIDVRHPGQFLRGLGRHDTLVENIGKNYASDSFSDQELSAWGVPEGNFEIRSRTFGKAISGMADEDIFVETKDTNARDQKITTRFTCADMVDYQTFIMNTPAGRDVLWLPNEGPIAKPAKDDPSFLKSAGNAVKDFTICAGSYFGINHLSDVLGAPEAYENLPPLKKDTPAALKL